MIAALALVAALTAPTPEPASTPATVAVATVGSAAATATHSSVGLENTLLVEQLADVATTQLWLHQRDYTTDRTPLHNGYHCKHGGGVNYCYDNYEADPIARPFVSTPLLNVASALAINGFVRLVPESARKHSILRVVDRIYPVFAAHNVRLLFRLGAR